MFDRVPRRKWPTAIHRAQPAASHSRQAPPGRVRSRRNGRTARVRQIKAIAKAFRTVVITEGWLHRLTGANAFRTFQSRRGRGGGYPKPAVSAGRAPLLVEVNVARSEIGVSPLPLHTDLLLLNAVEGFFAKLSKRRLKRGVFRSVVDLQAAINRFVSEANQLSKPFTWTADPDKIIAAVKRGHQVLDSIH